MELRTHDRKNTFEDIIEDQIVDEEQDIFYTTSIEQELSDEDFYSNLNELEKLLDLSTQDLRKTIEEDEELKMLFEKSEIDIDDENLKNELREMTLTVELMFINNVINKYIDDDALEISEENRNSARGQASRNQRAARQASQSTQPKGLKELGTKGKKSPLHILFSYVDNIVQKADDKITHWFNKSRFMSNIKNVPFFKRKVILISAATIIAVVISMKIFSDRSFILNPRYYKDKMAKLKDKPKKYDPGRIVKAVPSSTLNELKRDGLSTISNIEKIIDDILNGAKSDKVYARLMNLNLNTYGMSFNIKDNGRLKVKRKTINRKVKKTTSELGYTDRSYDSVVRDLNEIREKFLKTHERIIDLQIGFIENPSKYVDIKQDVVKSFLPSLITILKYVFDTVFKDFYNTAYAIK